MTLQLVTAADQDVVSALAGDDEIVRDKAVPALDEIEHAFRFADATFPGEEKPHAEHIGE
jgi:hypothetical protein